MLNKGQQNKPEIQTWEKYKIKDIDTYFIDGSFDINISKTSEDGIKKEITILKIHTDNMDNLIGKIRCSILGTNNKY